MTDPLLIDGLKLADDIYKTGIVFTLEKELDVPLHKIYSKKIRYWHISTKDKSKIVVAKSKRILKGENVFKLGYAAVQEFLDFLSVEIRHFNSIKDYQNHVLWYVEANKKILQAISRSAINVSSRSQVTIKPVDKRKKERVIENNLPEHHSAMRYFRLSRNNKDIIDCFRNLYLAFEQLLSSLTPRRIRPHEGEWDWIKRGLNNVSKKKDLMKIFNCTISEIPSKFKDKIYLVRNALFHAKAGDIVYLPQDLIYKKEIIESLQKLEYINWILFDEYYNMRIGRGGMVIGGLQSIVNNFCNKEKQFKILISDRVGELNEDGTLKDELSTNYLIGKANHIIEHCSSNVYVDFKIDEVLEKMTSFSRSCVIGSGGLYQMSQLEKPILLSKAIDILRVHEHNDVTSDDFHQFFY